jgi:hypothetical protein
MTSESPKNFKVKSRRFRRKAKMSKRFLFACLLIILISACTNQVITPAPATERIQPVASYTLEAISIVTATHTATRQPLPNLTLVNTATTSSVCPGALAPQVAVGQQVTVVAEDYDKLKLRSKPELSSDAVIMELDKSTRLNVIGGFVCVQSDETGTSYWFWQVEVIPSGEIGWVAEGDSLRYFILSSRGRQSSTAIAIDQTAIALTCPGALLPRVMPGQQVTVVTDDSDKLKLRYDPKTSPDTVKKELAQYTQLYIIDGPVCVYSSETGINYWFWMVAVLPNGEVGWVAEGDSLNYFIQ